MPALEHHVLHYCDQISVAETLKQRVCDGSLVRPHPEKDGKYQIAFGHRRVRAATVVGRPVRAIVRPLSDPELAIAQGLENNARQDLSFIEKSRFGLVIDEKFGREPALLAIATNKHNGSVMLKIARGIHPDVLTAIGRAPKIGMPRWSQLHDLLENDQFLAKTKIIILSEKFTAIRVSDERFSHLLKELTHTERPEQIEEFLRFGDRCFGSVRKSEKQVTLQLDRRDNPEFAGLVSSKLHDFIENLYQDFTTTKPAVE